MLKGDLAATPLADVLRSLAETEAIGCLHIADADGDEALVYFKRGLVYSAHVPGRRPQLGARLISSGALAPEALEEALEAQASELQGWRLGELLVHLGYVDRAVIEAFVIEQLREACFDLSQWQDGKWKFRKNEKTREDVGGSATVDELLAEVTRRSQEWELINDAVHGPDAVPALGAGGLAAAEMTLDQDQWALLCKVDGVRSIAQLARDCGFTDFEAGRIVFSLVTTGLLEVEETIGDRDDSVADLGPEISVLASSIASVLSGSLDQTVEDVLVEDAADDVPASARISSALLVPLTSADEQPDLLAGWPELADGDEPSVVSEISRLLAGSAPVAELPTDLEGITSELASLSASFSESFELPNLAMPASFEPEFPTFADLDDITPTELQPQAAEPYSIEEFPDQAVSPTDLTLPAPVAPLDEFGDSLARVSAALSDLLGDSLPPSTPLPPAVFVEVDEAAARAAAEEAQRLELSGAAAAAEMAAAHAELEAEWRQSEEQAREAALQAVEAERLAAEAAEAERHAAELAELERVAAEEANRLAQEAAERAATDEAERAAAEEAERLAVEAQRMADEAAEAERVAAEEAARLAAEARHAEEEAQRLAEEEARLADAEAQRLADEEARIAAEEAAALEAEEEAQRLADEATLAAALAAEEALAYEELELVTDDTEDSEVHALDGDTTMTEVASLLRDITVAVEATAEEAVDEDVVDDVEDEPEPEPDPDPEPPRHRPVRRGRDMGETAAFLRELSSLGLEDEPAGASVTANGSSSRPAASKEPAKKRKGLFGRG